MKKLIKVLVLQNYCMDFKPMFLKGEATKACSEAMPATACSCSLFGSKQLLAHALI